MKTDQDLIFEAYAKTPNENYNNVGALEQLGIFIETNPVTKQELAPIYNEIEEIAEELVKFDDFMDGEDKEEYLYLIKQLSPIVKT